MTVQKKKIAYSMLYALRKETIFLKVLQIHAILTKPISELPIC